MSGIIGVFRENEIKAVSIIKYGLYALQHRGEQGVGIATLEDDYTAHELRGSGLLSDAIKTEEDFKNLSGNKGIGIVKYTFGHESTQSPIMPYVKTISNGNEKKCFLAIDGNVTNEDFNPQDLIQVIATNEDALPDYISKLDGAFSIIFVSNDKMVAIRDKKGVKPLSLGKFRDTMIIASETCAFDSIGGEYIRDIERGEIFIIRENEMKSMYGKREVPALCLFEMIYIARPDSYIDKQSVYQARYNMGARLYDECITDADIVIGAPDSGLIASLGYAHKSGIAYHDGILKNRYIGRTFIRSNQHERDFGVRIKLNPITVNLKDKRVILVDDSIVRGTTIKRIVSILKEAGVKEIHIRITSPPVIKGEKDSLDIPDESNLLSSGRTIEEVREYIGCDSIYFLSLDGLEDCCGNNGYYKKYFGVE